MKTRHTLTHCFAFQPQAPFNNLQARPVQEVTTRAPRPKKRPPPTTPRNRPSTPVPPTITVNEQFSNFPGFRNSQNKKQKQNRNNQQQQKSQPQPTQQQQAVRSQQQQLEAKRTALRGSLQVRSHFILLFSSFSQISQNTVLLYHQKSMKNYGKYILGLEFW